MALGCLGLASDKVAVVIGVNQYSDASIAPLRFAKADAVEVSSVLTTNGWDVITITTDESGSTGSATASGIQAALKQVAKRGKLDSFIFYFCGHGFSNSKKVGYLALGDTTLSNLESTALAIPSLIDASGTIDATHKSFFFDACRNDPSRAIGVETKKMDKDLFESFRSLSEETSAAVFLSCKQGELSYENDALKHGVFTFAVLEGLRGEAAVEGTVTSDSLKSYVSKRVPEIDKTQTPWAFVSGSAPAEYSKGSKTTKAAKPAVKQGFTLVSIDQEFLKEHGTSEIRLKIDGKSVEVINLKFFYVPKGKHDLEFTFIGKGISPVWNESIKDFDKFRCRLRQVGVGEGETDLIFRIGLTAEFPMDPSSGKVDWSKPKNIKFGGGVGIAGRDFKPVLSYGI